MTECKACQWALDWFLGKRPKPCKPFGHTCTVKARIAFFRKHIPGAYPNVP